LPTSDATDMSTSSWGAKRVTPVRMSCGTFILSEDSEAGASSSQRNSPSLQVKRSSSFLARFCCSSRKRSAGVTSPCSIRISPKGTPRAAERERQAVKSSSPIFPSATM
jgi:hypothetical protein